MTIKKLAKECGSRPYCDGCLYKNACRKFKHIISKKSPAAIVEYIKFNWEIEHMR